MAARRLLLDAMLGGLRSYLRICGYDAAYALDRDVTDDDELLAWARAEERRVVTRDRDLGRRAEDALVLTDREVTAQLRALAECGFDLEPSDQPRRCGRCNGELRAVDPGERTPDNVPDPGDPDGSDGTGVWRCVDCGQHFWKGSHWADVRETLASVRESVESDDRAG